MNNSLVVFTQNHNHQVPNDIRVPDYLKTYLENLSIPSHIDTTFLLTVGQEALVEKQLDVANFNIANNARKKRPERLDFEDVAIIMMTFFVFRNIKMTNRDNNTLLAVYVDDPDAKQYGTYTSDVQHMYALMERLAPTFRKTDMQDTLDKIERSVITVEINSNKHLFIVKNGIYDQKNDQLLPFTPNLVYLTKIPIEYQSNPINPIITAADGYQWDVDTWLSELTEHDIDICTLIWQVIADSLQPHRSRHKSIWFYSEKGNNGKGTIGQLIKNLIGEGNYASLSVADFKHEFLKETLLGVAANISDENDVDIFIDSVKDYKASITGDDININRKYEKPLRIQFFGTNIQMLNGLPKTKDRSDSFYRRLIIVPFLKSFTNNGERKYIKNDYIYRKEVLEYVLFKALKIDFDEYIVPEESAILMESYKEKNNPALEFWNEFKEDFVWDLLPTQFLYDLFLKWSNINNPNGKVMSKRSFTDALTCVILDSDAPWEIKTSQNDKVRTGTKMDKDEPIISEYGLDRPDKNGKPSYWGNMNYNGNDQEKRRRFDRKNTYRGYVRIIPAVQTTPDPDEPDTTNTNTDN